ncbi:MAG: UDP-N-acetylmuramoyl-tripeptide--D-alanyl-D-alanine ligase [Actinomycetaceae bacterium]|nr:UDP-N-acetylmuramoyl-tripeptide--D-alanyl-D-alanine ligase [Actinomycetaceae bacterium]
MIPVTLTEVARDCEGTFRAGGSPSVVADDVVTALTTDTRTIAGGEVFAAIKGERIDGSTLAGDALSAGARAVLTADPEVAAASGADPERIIAVPDVRQAIGKLARANLARARSRGNPDLRVVAVTGSVGKTTTKDLLAALLAPRGQIIAPPGSLNNELGLPLTVLRAGQDTATLVLEMGADHVGNIDYLTSIAPPDVAVVLAVARAHLGEFGGIDNVARAKSELVTGTREGGTVILNADDERVAAMAQLARGPVVTFSASGDGDVAARNVALGADGRASFDLAVRVGGSLAREGEGGARVSLRLVGEHHVSNALAAAAAALAVGADLADVCAALGETAAASPHRMDVFECEGATIVDDSYNANPDSMRAGLAALAKLGEDRRRVAILGEMLELGEATEAEHASLGRCVADAGVAALVCLGSATAATARSARQAGVHVHDAADSDGALAALRSILKPGDVVLLKGSNGSGVWRIADALRGEAK